MKKPILPKLFAVQRPSHDEEAQLSRRIGLVIFFLSITCYALTPTGGYISPVITIIPTARAIGMGSVGYALSDDETGLMYNPAGLGLKNERWRNGVVSFTNGGIVSSLSEQLYTIAYQNENYDRIGFAGCFDRIKTSIIKTVVGVDGPGQITRAGVINFYDLKYGLGMGYRFYSNKMIDNSIGVSGNFYQYLQDTSMGSTMTRFLGNIGYILQIQKKIRIGLSLKNIEISNSGSSSLYFYGKMPMAFCTGIGYKDSFNGRELRILDLSAEISYVDWLSITTGISSIQTGCEAVLLNTFSARFGLSNISGAILSFGEGISLFNHFDIDMFHVLYVSTPERENGFGIGFSVKRILNWKESDKKWWRK